MGNDINNQSPLPTITIFSNVLPIISDYPLRTTSNTKFFLYIKHLNSSSHFNTSNPIFMHLLSNYDICLLTTTTLNMYLFIIHIHFIKEYIYISVHKNDYASFLKECSKKFSITITPSIQSDCMDEMNQMFDINCLYQKGVRLNKDKKMNTIVGNRELGISAKNLNSYKFAFYAKKSKSLKNEDDSIKGKSIDEVYEEYIKKQNKKRKEDAILFNNRYPRRNVFHKK